MNNKALKICWLMICLVLLLPSFLFADDYYDAAGFNPNRETFSMVPYEHIDTFTGGVILNFIDAKLPGNGGLDLVVQRTYNSKIWKNINTLSQRLVENSWMGTGWSLHFGRVISPDSQIPIIEMPDGSRHKAYVAAGDTSKKITTDYWIYNSHSTPPTLTLTDGRTIYFGHRGPLVEGVTALYATKITDADGNTINITYKYPLAGNDIIAYIEDTNGRRVTFSTTVVNGAEKLTRISGPGINMTYTHVAVPEAQYSILTKATPAVGASWTYSYNTTNNPLYELTGVTSPAGGAISYAYATKAFVIGGSYVYFRTIVSRQASGRDIPSGTWTFNYQSGTSGDTTTISDPCGRTVTYQHYGYGYGNQWGELWKTGLLFSKAISGEETVNYGWDKSAAISYVNECTPFYCDYDIWAPRLISKSITRGGKTYTTNYSNYDSYGNPQRISEAGDKSRTTDIAYWTNASKNIVQGRPASEAVSGSYPGTFTTSYTYDTNTGRITSITKYGVRTDFTYYSNGNLYTQKDANGNIASYQWTNGNISKITNPLYSITRSINSDGTVASETNGRGHITSFTYDGNQRLTSKTPPAGNVINYTYPADNSYVKEARGGFYTYRYFDGFGRLSGTQDSLGATTDIQYKSCGPKYYTTSNTGDTVYYDHFGRKTSVLHRDSSSISYAYSGSNVTVTDEAAAKTYLYYEAFGNPDEKLLVKVVDAKSNSTDYTYNMAGSLTGMTQGGLARSYTYSTKNFLSSETHPEKGTISYGRDSVGNMTSKTDSLGTVSYSYDGLHRLKTISYTSGQVNFGYDNADNRISMSNPHASASYGYDPANRLTNKAETISGRNYPTSYSYDGNDNLTDIYYPSGRHAIYAYNANNQITSVSGFGGTISGISYYTSGNYLGLPSGFTYANGLYNSLTYNSRNLTTQVRAGASALNIGYGYDSRGNTTSIVDYLDRSRDQSLSYDSLNRLETFNAGGLWGTGLFTYDASGNRMSKTVAGVTTSYGYSGNRLAATSGGEAFSFGYNGSGDVTSLNGYALEYDQLHNLTSYKQNGTPVAGFSYDGDGMRITKTADGKTIVYHYDQGGRLLSESYSDGMLIADYVYLFGKLAAKVVATPTLSVTPAPKDFGAVPLGTQPLQTFTIANTGSAVLELGATTLSGAQIDEFVKTADNCSGRALAPGGSCTVDVTLTPRGIGVKNAILSIVSNDPDSPTKNIALTGTVVVTLTTSKSGLGIGTVTSSPAGISCGTDCTENYSQVTTITLTASPDACSDFAGWSGGGCSGTGECTVTVDSSHVTITALFNPKPITAAFSMLPESGYAPLFVTLTDLSAHCPVSWSWTFGDGSSSNVQNPPLHNFEGEGSYTVSLTVINRAGVSSTATKTVTAQACPNHPVRIGTTYFPSLQAAYDAAADGDVIQSHAIRFYENVTIAKQIAVTFDGGYGCDYSSKRGFTTLQGQMETKPGAGTVTVKSFMLTYDTSPVTTVAAPTGGYYNAPQNITLTCTGPCGPVYYTTDGSQPTTASSVYTGPVAISSTTTLKFFALTTEGGRESIRSQTYIMDTAPPTGGITINGGAALTNSISVTLSLTCTDDNGCAHMKFSTDNAVWSSAEAYSTGKAWQLSSGDGTKSVYVKYQDMAGNWSPEAYNADIVLDATPPVVTVSPAGGTYSSTQSVVLGSNEPATIYYTADGSDPLINGIVYTNPLDIAVTTTLRFYAKDSAGNSSAGGQEIYSIGVPTCSISINSGAPFTNSTAVTATIGCGGGNSCTEMQFSNDNAVWSAAEPYASTRAWELAAGDGSKTVYAKVKNTIGGWSSACTATIVLDTALPVASASPPGGVYTVPQEVMLTCSDGTGSGCGSIYYTIDGSTPTLQSLVYNGPLTVAATTTLNFFAADRAGNSGSVTAATYTIDANAALPVRIAGTAPYYFSTLQDAYNAAIDGDVIHVQGTTLVESLTVNRNISVLIDGGYSNDFSNKSGFTTLKGTVQTLPGGGTITLKNFMLIQ
ncbi:MAG: chitobiase/beta-hexosaminidase C-terminal domain-containing protein [Nitrospirota bacterium]